MGQLRDGLSERTLAFEPGFEAHGEVVCRTFQPSYVVLGGGNLLAFCQGRLREGRDDDPKVVLMSRSADCGATWSPAKAVSARLHHYAMSAYRSEREGRERVSVLTMVDMRGTEKLYGHDHGAMRERTGIDIDAVGSRTPMVLCRFDSDDGGESWTMETLLGERSPLNRRYADGTLIMFNPVGQVHVIPEGPHRGRYLLGGPVTVVPGGEAVSDYFRDHPQSGSAVLCSDDQGETWRADGFITDYLANEASAVSIRGGEELLMMRRLNPPDRLAERSLSGEVNPGPMQRIAHTSADWGRTWSPPFLVDISGVLCHGTLARRGRRLLFSIPNGPGRRRGAIYCSDDEGRIWGHKVIDSESFSYSTVGPLNESQYITLYARGSMGQEGVGCRVFEDEWL
ncbi:MAG: sialidase family protein [Gemmatimonadaceae bacterium]|nr:sialidase family protein [Gemmatimonadaceae bacterium]